MTSFHLEIITPTRSVYSEDVEMVTVPGSGGEMGILAGHVPLFTSLVEGEVKVVNGKDEWYLAIGGGFMEVSKKAVTILVSRAYHAKELNESEIKKAYEAAQTAIKKGGQEAVVAQTQLRRSILELKVLSHYRRKSPISSS